MEVLTGLEELRAWRARGGRVGLVPTMGALHAGHLALVAALRPQVDRLAVSVFVNPTQFGPGEDLARYPRDLERDLALAAEAGADLVWAPAAEVVYPPPSSTFVTVEGLTDVLEGAARPGHFRGVATVVAKLFAAFQPRLAAFGQKDAQQAIIVRRLARELLLPTRIVVVPTVREPDGLALSSRNVYLSPAERAAAPGIHAALNRAVDRVRAGERDGTRLQRELAADLARLPGAALDYAAVVSTDDLAPLGRLDGRVLLAAAVRFPSARLIDNLCLRVAGGRVADDLP